MHTKIYTWLSIFSLAETLRTYFEKYGTVVEVKIKQDQVTQRSRYSVPISCTPIPFFVQFFLVLHCMLIDYVLLCVCVCVSIFAWMCVCVHVHVQMRDQCVMRY